jgi:diguanylate cyclase (GGDEF)-like protein
MQAYFILSKSPYDRSVIGYAFFGFVIFYFAICYRPLRLLDQLLSNIVSDLSDAFYIFDPTGKCIWANEQGCRLVGFTGKNYEEINAGLTAIFGEPLVSDDAPDRRAVGEGEDVRFYSLEEKQVQGSSGRYNGSYLRIRDVTDDEREIQVRDQQIGQISREAYKDALTGVGSKSAYNNKVVELNGQLAEGLTDFAVVMVDLNDLKQINDQFGHKAGDQSIRGCCHLVCEAFKHSPVFRIGGDEFVAILRGADFEARHENVQSLRTAYSQAYEQPDVEPWQRYSASVGMAERASDDNSFELVFKRADQAMYEEKKSFKEQHGSYR